MSTRICDPEANLWVHRLHKAASRAAKEDEVLAAVVKAAREAGCSWTVIANGLGVHRASAHRTWGPKMTKRRSGAK